LTRNDIDSPDNRRLEASMFLDLKTLTATVAGLICFAFAGAAELAPPVPLTAGDRPIDVEHSGHAAPFVADLDGRGRQDLLVGELFDGRLRIYRNAGTDAEPRFEKFEWFQAGRELGRIPSG
jgi:hypothetical protein